MLSLIVAIDLNNAIGYKNELLWHLSQDLKYFKKTTSGHPVIMGRKTYESIGRPLPGRRNIVISRGSISTEQIASANELIKDKSVTSFEVVSDISSLIGESKKSADEFFVMGGGQLYKQLFDFADRLYITQIHAAAPNADTYFPEIRGEEWSVSSQSEEFFDEENQISFSFIIYDRNAR